MAGQGHILRLRGRPIPKAPGEIRCVMVVRNEALRLPHVLEHHRRLGVDRFLIVDNASTDGTADLIAAQPDAHLLVTEDSYAAAGYGVRWWHVVLDRLCVCHWCVVVDADELLVYPGFEHHGLRELTAWLDVERAEGVFTAVLDMYSDWPIRDTVYHSGQPLLEAAPYFDRGPYERIDVPQCPGVQLYGGPRTRLFSRGSEFIVNPPTVSKVPLVRWTPGRRFLLSQHAITPLRVSALEGALLHFKLLADFHDRAVAEAERGEHFAGAREYKVYRDLMAADPGLCAMCDASERWSDSWRLVELGLSKAPPGWRAIAGHGPRPPADMSHGERQAPVA
jgi:hypothetical protein